jgi:hypothetical protein
MEDFIEVDTIESTQEEIQKVQNLLAQLKVNEKLLKRGKKSKKEFWG